MTNPRGTALRLDEIRRRVIEIREYAMKRGLKRRRQARLATVGAAAVEEMIAQAIAFGYLARLTRAMTPDDPRVRSVVDNEIAELCQLWQAENAEGPQLVDQHGDAVVSEPSEEPR
jgi:hypothetical protein